jgi:pimeloyl-ACP methyl ester carboxylesterase
VRSLSTGERITRHHVVIVPGLGALAYLMPLVRELGQRGIRTTLLDLPGFGRGDGPGSAPTIMDVADAVVRWCSGLAMDENLILFGHSTGSQAALLAAVRMQGGRPPAALVLAGPTVAPNQRSLPRLMATAPMAYRRDSPAELRALGDYRRSGRDVLILIRSAIADRPERTVRELTIPLLVTAGRSDAFAPPGWLVTLTHAAASRIARVVRLPGSHNNPYTHPAAMATVVEALAVEAEAPRRPRRARRSRREGNGLRRSA